ncbi:RNA-guided endonuclease InsQ/TnpB family protein [Streptomyces sp. NPDC057900]|uniref:RNA-guided endonuclease InsQ/TnpB family protein n=1 Tax=Streptomyces sp. NPDC057900 TaxID=3346274 RepID=UPI0036F0D058
MFAGRKYRAELTDEQRAAAEGYAGVCRAVWNTGLEQRRHYRRRGAWISYREQAGQLVQAKRDARFEWLRQPPGHVLQQVLMDLDKACRTHGTWAVRWKSKASWQPSMRFPDGQSLRVEQLSRKWARVKLPKLGWVRFRLSRALGGVVRSVTLRREGCHWYVSILVDTPERERTVSLERGRIGVDRGVVSAVVTSDADQVSGRGFFDRAFITPGEAERYVRLQRRLARARKGSGRRSRIKAAMAVIMGRVSRRRRDFQAQTARVLVRGNALVVIEDLNTRGMTASAKGSPDRPGRMVAQKSGLNRAILDKGWCGLETALRSAARTTGTRIRKINPAYTSQTCPACRRVDAASRKNQAEFVCTSCTHAEHADVVGAKNTLAAGHGGYRTWSPPGIGRGRETSTGPPDSRCATAPADG